MTDTQGDVRLWAALIWHDTILAERVLTGSELSVGASGGADLVLPDGVGIDRRHRLVSRADGALVLHLLPNMGGYRVRDGARVPLERLRGAEAGALLMQAGDRWLIELGRITLYLEADHPARMPRTPIWWALDAPLLSALNGAVVAHLGVLIAAFWLWVPTPGLATVPLDLRSVRFVTQRPPPPAPLEQIAGEESPRAEGEEGEVGEPDKDTPTKIPHREGPAVADLKRGKAGIVRALDALGDQGPLGNVLGNSANLSAHLEAAMAGHDDSAVAGRGAGGLGLRGTRSGGGGEGLGRLAAMGGPGIGGHGVGRGRGLRKHKQRGPRIHPGGPKSLDGHCKAADILRVVEAHRNGVSYCYEKALQASPGLEGKVTLWWMIDPAGHTQRARVEANTLGDRSVGACMVRAVKRWRFTKPEGGLCAIRFPFTFSAGLQ